MMQYFWRGSGKRRHWWSYLTELGQMSQGVSCWHWSTSTKIFQPLRPEQNYWLQLKQELRLEIKSDLRQLAGIEISPCSSGSWAKGLLVYLNIIQSCCTITESQILVGDKGRQCWLELRSILLQDGWEERKFWTSERVFICGWWRASWLP